MDAYIKRLPASLSSALWPNLDESFSALKLIGKKGGGALRWIELRAAQGGATSFWAFAGMARSFHPQISKLRTLA